MPDLLAGNHVWGDVSWPMTGALQQGEDLAQLVQQLPEAHQASENPRGQIQRALASASMRQQVHMCSAQAVCYLLNPMLHPQSLGFSGESSG